MLPDALCRRRMAHGMQFTWSLFRLCAVQFGILVVAFKF